MVKTKQNKRVTAEMVVQTARQYLGASYSNQGRTKEYGLDCGGLLLVVGRELGITELEHLGYSNSPDGVMFEKLLRKELREIVPKEKVKIGDVLAMDYGDGIQHTGFVTEIEPRLTAIHAKRDRGVVEQYLHGYDLRGWVKTFRIRGIKH